MNVIEHMEASHTEAAKAMQCMKKLIMTIPFGAFLFDVTSDGATLYHDSTSMTCIRSGEEEKHHTDSLVDMVPDGQLSQNLRNPVTTLAAILHCQLKNETGIKISITTTSKLFGT